MNNFPLYDRLSQASQNIVVNSEYFKLVAMTINSLDKDQSRIIYALILHHSNITGQLSREIPSYGGKDNRKSKGILYDFHNLPQDLKSIIALYVISLSI